MSSQTSVAINGAPGLVRSLRLTHAVLYGLGVTIGAGIYVLVGVAAGRSGMHAPLAFFGAALVMAFSAASFAELGTRMPVSASEAAYVQAALEGGWPCEWQAPFHAAGCELSALPLVLGQQ